MREFTRVLLPLVLVACFAQSSFGQLKQQRTMNQDGEIVMLDFPRDFRNKQGLQIGEDMPEFTLIDIAGDTITTTDLNDKLLVMNFWFVGCTGCKQEEPNLTKLTSELKNKNIEFVSICNSSIGRTSSYIKRNGSFGYKVISIKSQKDLEEIFGMVHPAPSHMIIKNGIVKEQFNFALTTDDEIEWYKERILEELQSGI